MCILSHAAATRSRRRAPFLPQAARACLLAVISARACQCNRTGIVCDANTPCRRPLMPVASVPL